MSPKIMEVAFLVENLAADLETAQLEVAAKEVEKIRRVLNDVFDEMHLLFAPQNPKGDGKETPGPVGAEP